MCRRSLLPAVLAVGGGLVLVGEHVLLASHVVGFLIDRGIGPANVIEIIPCSLNKY